jgi:hypothetical protein
MLVLKFIMGFGLGFLLALITEFDASEKDVAVHTLIYGAFATMVIISQTGGE